MKLNPLAFVRGMNPRTQSGGNAALALDNAVSAHPSGKPAKTSLDRFFGPGLSGDILAIIAGAILTLAFAPFNVFPLAILSPALLLALWLKVSPGRAFFRGWLFGLALFGTGVYWVYNSIHIYGGASIPLSCFITVGFVNILALFPAFNGLVLNRYFKINNATKILCAFPALWVALEWVRSWLFTGFPWLSLGYSQTSTMLKGYALFFSIYGISLVLALCSALLVNAARLYFLRKKSKAAYYNLGGILALWLLGALLFLHVWTQPQGAPMPVSLIQGNIPQAVKWSPEALQPTLDRYQSLTEANWNSKLIIWPEGAVPLSLIDAIQFITLMKQEAIAHQSTIFTGIPIKLPTSNGYYNAIIAMGTGSGIYLKHRLVPFGEYIPFQKQLSGLLSSLDIPMSDFIPAPRVWRPLVANGTLISAFICYEIAFPETVLSRNGDIGLLLTVSNDGWFGHSIAQAQHLQIAQMRAIEMGRPLLFVGNDGPTAIINFNGKIQASIPPYQTGVLTGDVQPRNGKTPWQYVAMDPLILAIIVLIVIAARTRKNVN